MHAFGKDLLCTHIPLPCLAQGAVHPVNLDVFEKSSGLAHGSLHLVEYQFDIL